MKAGVGARISAATAVGRVIREGAWSNRIVEDAAVGSPADRALIRFLIYGTLRNRARIDRTLADRVSRPLHRVTPAVLDVLRVATMEILFAETPDHAAVSVGVEAVKELGESRASGFVNGVLRSVVRSGETPIDDDDLATMYSVADDVVERLVAAWGMDETRNILAGSHADAPRHVRIRPGQISPVDAVPTSVDGVVEVPPGPLGTDMIVQDASSVAVGQAAGDVAGLRVLDIAAAPGGKTLQLADGGPAVLVAADAHRKRLMRARRRLASTAPEVCWVLADGTAPPFADGAFDVVLLDAPCTGLGTLRRRPELRERASAAEIDRLASLQARLLAAARRLVRPGGRVVYSVCTVTKEETEAVAAPAGGRPPEGLRGRTSEVGLFMGPHLSGSDGMFISVIDG